MISPSDYELSLIIAALGGAQLFTVRKFYRLLSQEFSREWKAHGPSVTVFVPFKGEAPGFAENIEAFLDQEYGGSMEVLFIAPSAVDPGYGVVEKRLARERPVRAKLLATDAVPTRSSGKAKDLIAALEKLKPESEVFLFADADIRVARDWVRRMVEPLQEPAIGVTTSALLYAPRTRGFWGFMRMVWNGCATMYAPLLDYVIGQSLAMRRADFEELEVARHWGSAVLEDMTMIELTRAWEKRVLFIGRAMPTAPESCGRGEFFGVCNKWILCFRFFDPGVWLLGMGCVLTKCAIVAWCATRSAWGLLAFFWALEMLFLYATFAVYGSFFPERYREIHPGYARLPLLAALSAPALLAAHVLNFLRSLVTSELRWGDYVYKVHSPRDIEVIKRR